MICFLWYICQYRAISFPSALALSLSPFFLLAIEKVTRSFFLFLKLVLHTVALIKVKLVSSYLIIVYIYIYIYIYIFETSRNNVLVAFLTESWKSQNVFEVAVSIVRACLNWPINFKTNFVENEDDECEF